MIHWKDSDKISWEPESLLIDHCLNHFVAFELESKVGGVIFVKIALSTSRGSLFTPDNLGASLDVVEAVRHTTDRTDERQMHLHHQRYHAH